jgi:hypothetical protein
MAKRKTATKDARHDYAIHCRYDALVDPGELKPNPGNPYIHTEKQVRVLAAIIRAAGWRQPIVVSKETGFVVKGHCRRLAALQLKAKAVPVEHQSYPDYDDEVADMIADNHVAELAYTDQATLTGIMSKMGQAAQRLTGFFTEEVAKAADTVAKTVERASAEGRPKATKEDKRAKAVPMCPVDGKPCPRAQKKRTSSVK